MRPNCITHCDTALIQQTEDQVYCLMLPLHGTKTCLSNGRITKMKHQSFLYHTKPFLTDSHLEYETKTFSEVLTEGLAQAE